MSRRLYLKVDKSGSGQYAQLARGIRTPAGVRTERVWAFGKVSPNELEELREAVRTLGKIGSNAVGVDTGGRLDSGGEANAKGDLPVATADGSWFVTAARHLSSRTEVDLTDHESISLPAFAYVDQGDRLTLWTNGSGGLVRVEKYVEFGPNGSSGMVQILPQYCRTERIRLGGIDLEMTFRERIGKVDWKAAKELEQFHYRGKGLNKIVGRRSVLVAEAKGWGIVGYVVLSSTVAAAKPRFELFNTNFGEQMRSHLINKIVRIPRVVVHPEFRGVGLGASLARHAVSYAREHLDINGYKPILLEVIASMTDYHRFFQVAGFIPLGETEGRKEVVKPAYGRNGWSARPNASKYDFHTPIGPKPYLVYPLDESVAKLVRDRVPSRSYRPGLFVPRVKLTRPIVSRKLTVVYRSDVKDTKRSDRVREIFGIGEGYKHAAVIRNLDLSILPGEVLLISGASGSGKSTLISLLRRDSLTRRLVRVTSETFAIQRRAETSAFEESFRSRQPLVNQVGRTLHEAIFALNEVGLAEAHLYLKSPMELSVGQRYRFGLARLCDSERPVWIADEFASTLDPRTAAVVSKGLRRLAAHRGATVIVACANPEPVWRSLLPTQHLQLHWGGSWSRWGIKLTARNRADRILIAATNTGLLPLTGVMVELQQSDGGAERLVMAQSLEAGERLPPFELDRKKLQGLIALRVTSREGVGDVRYVTKFLPGSSEVSLQG